MYEAVRFNASLLWKLTLDAVAKNLQFKHNHEILDSYSVLNIEMTTKTIWVM